MNSYRLSAQSRARLKEASVKIIYNRHQVVNGDLIDGVTKKTSET